MLAARFNSVEVLEYLADRGASLDMRDDQRFTNSPCSNGWQNSKSTGLIELGADVFKESYEYVPAIHLAAENDHTGIVRLLLEHGADADLPNGLDLTPLALAAQNGHLETVQLLLKYGGQLNRAAECGSTPIHYAAKNNHTEMVKFIVRNGGNILVKTFDGEQCYTLLPG